MVNPFLANIMIFILEVPLLICYNKLNFNLVYVKMGIFLLTKYYFGLNNIRKLHNLINFSLY